MCEAKKGLASGPGNPLRRSARWTAARRETCLAVLRATGNARAAAEAIGMDRTTLEHRCRNDPGFARDWDQALAAAHARIAGIGAAIDAGEAIEDGPDPFETIRRGAGGRLQIAAAGKGRWNAGVEARFFALLGQNGNMSASARAVGFTPETVWERRRTHPGFAKRLAAALEDAEIELEFRLARLGSDIVPAAGGEAGPAETAAPPPFDPEFALKFLKWREEKRNGRGRRGRGDRDGPAEPPIEEVRASIMRKLDAIERHEQRQAAKREDCGK